MQNKAQLLKEINETSFAVNDVTLYLDTHPNDQQAMEFFYQCKDRRKKAMEQFEKDFYPLTVDCISQVNSTCWKWNEGPAPWEGEMA